MQFAWDTVQCLKNSTPQSKHRYCTLQIYFFELCGDPNLYSESLNFLALWKTLEIYFYIPFLGCLPS